MNWIDFYFGAFLGVTISFGVAMTVMGIRDSLKIKKARDQRELKETIRSILDEHDFYKTTTKGR